MLNQKLRAWKELLLKTRNERPKPRLDDKTLTSWNALMLKGYVDAYMAFNDEKFLTMALKNAHFLLNRQFKEDGGLYRNYKNGKSTIDAYLEDYATLIDAYLSLYQVTLDENWLQTAKQLTDHCFDHFYDDKNKNVLFHIEQQPGSDHQKNRDRRQCDPILKCHHGQQPVSAGTLLLQRKIQTNCSHHAE